MVIEYQGIAAERGMPRHEIADQPEENEMPHYIRVRFERQQADQYLPSTFLYKMRHICNYL
jgi:hypothetical protein